LSAPDMIDSLMRSASWRYIAFVLSKLMLIVFFPFVNTSIPVFYISITPIHDICKKKIAKNQNFLKKPYEPLFMGILGNKYFYNLYEYWVFGVLQVCYRCLFFEYVRATRESPYKKRRL
jgi:hypothetical protein